MSKKIAIVYDWMDKWGGVERILQTIHTSFPDADFYTSYFNEEKASWAKGWNIKTSFIQKLPNFIKQNRILSLSLFPYAFESFDLREYDIVISVTSAFAKAIITRPETKHICYLLTPPRYLWGMEDEYLNNPLKKILGAGLLEKLREFDFISAQRPDTIICISKTVAKRCQKYYHRDSDILYPPFDLNYWESIKQDKPSIKFEKYFLVVSRLEPYKQVDLVIKTFNRLKDKNLIIVGKGSQKDILHTMAKGNIQFLEDLSDSHLAYLYKNAEALIMPQEEDFGYVSLEGQFFGCPIITYFKGGGAETVIDGKTGVYFYEQTEKGLIEGLDRFHTIAYNVKDRVLDTYSKDKFQKKLNELLY